MNICVFSTHFGGGYGTGYSIRKEIAEFEKSGHNIFVIHSEKNISPYQIKGVEYFYSKISKIPLLNILLLKREIKSAIGQIIKNNRIDIFYIQSLEFGSCIGEIAGTAPIVYFARSTIRGIETNKPKEYWLDDLRRKLITPILIYLEKRCLRMSNLIIVKSSLIKDELTQLYRINDKKIKIVPGGIDNADFPKMSKEEKNKIRKAMNLPLNKKILLYSGRIVPVKGLYYLVKSLNELIAGRDDIVLIVAGKSMQSQYFKVIENMIRSHRLEQHVVFAGYVPQHLMFRYYGICDIVVLPSTYEPFGMTAIQAIIMGKPLIITNRVGAVENIKEYPLLKVVPAHDSKSLTYAIASLLDLKINGEANKFDLSKLYWNNMALELQRLFIGLIQNRKR